MSTRLQSNHASKGQTLLKSVHCMLKLSLKLAIKGKGDPLIVKQLINLLFVYLFSVFMEHKENLGMRLCPWPIFIFDVSLFLCTLRECDK